jgi:hypothetical protein
MAVLGCSTVNESLVDRLFSDQAVTMDAAGLFSRDRFYAAAGRGGFLPMVLSANALRKELQVKIG